MLKSGSSFGIDEEKEVTKFLKKEIPVELWNK